MCDCSRDFFEDNEYDCNNHSELYLQDDLLCKRTSTTTTTFTTPTPTTTTTSTSTTTTSTSTSTTTTTSTTIPPPEYIRVQYHNLGTQTLTFETLGVAFQTSNQYIADAVQTDLTPSQIVLLNQVLHIEDQAYILWLNSSFSLNYNLDVIVSLQIANRSKIPIDSFIMNNGSSGQELYLQIPRNFIGELETIYIDFYDIIPQTTTTTSTSTSTTTSTTSHTTSSTTTTSTTVGRIVKFRSEVENTSNSALTLNFAYGQINPLVNWYNINLTLPSFNASNSQDFIVTSSDNPLTGNLSIKNTNSIPMYYNIYLRNNANGIVPSATSSSGQILPGITTTIQSPYTYGHSSDDYNLLLAVSTTPI